MFWRPMLRLSRDPLEVHRLWFPVGDKHGKIAPPQDHVGPYPERLQRIPLRCSRCCTASKTPRSRRPRQESLEAEVPVFGQFDPVRPQLADHPSPENLIQIRDDHFHEKRDVACAQYRTRSRTTGPV